jgi:hypothetical protein
VTSLHLICNSNYEALLFSAAFSLFFALLRVGEITADSRSNDGVHTLRAGDISFKDNYMHVTIRSSKADQHGEQVTLILSKQEKGLCPINSKETGIRRSLRLPNFVPSNILVTRKFCVGSLTPNNLC